VQSIGATQYLILGTRAEDLDIGTEQYKLHKRKGITAIENSNNTQEANAAIFPLFGMIYQPTE
jgi:hypothetical protein